MNKDGIKVLREVTCNSLSGNAIISYEIGSLGEEQYIRLVKSDKGGLCSRDWIPLAEIQKILKGVAKPTTSALRTLYTGKSSNSAGFLLTCIINERLAEKNSAPTTPDPPPQKKPAKVKKSKNEEQS